MENLIGALAQQINKNTTVDETAIILAEPRTLLLPIANQICDNLDRLLRNQFGIFVVRALYLAFTGQGARCKRSRQSSDHGEKLPAAWIVPDFADEVLKRILEHLQKLGMIGLQRLACTAYSSVLLQEVLSFVPQNEMLRIKTEGLVRLLVGQVESDSKSSNNALVGGLLRDPAGSCAVEAAVQAYPQLAGLILWRSQIKGNVAQYISKAIEYHLVVKLLKRLESSDDVSTLIDECIPQVREAVANNFTSFSQTRDKSNLSQQMEFVCAVLEAAIRTKYRYTEVLSEITQGMTGTATLWTQIASLGYRKEKTNRDKQVAGQTDRLYSRQGIELAILILKLPDYLAQPLMDR